MHCYFCLAFSCLDMCKQVYFYMQTHLRVGCMLTCMGKEMSMISFSWNGMGPFFEKKNDLFLLAINHKIFTALIFDKERGEKILLVLQILVKQVYYKI